MRLSALGQRIFAGAFVFVAAIIDDGEHAIGGRWQGFDDVVCQPRNEQMDMPGGGVE